MGASLEQVPLSPRELPKVIDTDDGGGHVDKGQSQEYVGTTR